MAVIFTETFASSLAWDYAGKKWTSVNGTDFQVMAQAASGYAIRLRDTKSISTRVFGTGAEKWVTWLFKPGAFTGTQEFLTLKNSSGTDQVSLWLLSSGQLEMRRGVTVLETSSSDALIVGGVYRLTVYVKIDSSTGAWRVAVDGADYLNDSGNTQAAGDTECSIAEFLSAGGNLDHYASDIVIWDTAGSILNGWQTGVKPVVLRTASDGTTTDFTPLSSTNESNVDETNRDEDSTYNSSSTAGHIDLFNFATLSGDYDVFAVVQNIHARKDDGATRTIREKCRQSSTNYSGTTKTTAETYENFDEIREVDPNSSAAWSVAGVNSAEFGYELVA